MPASRSSDLDGIAATAGPGLIGGLIVGLTTAKAMAPRPASRCIAVNHLEGHALTARLTDGLAFPYLLLLASGGHTQLVAVRGVGDYERSAPPSTTRSARPSTRRRSCSACPIRAGPGRGGAALDGDATRFDLPRPMKGRAEPDFSFSGLKTAVRRGRSRSRRSSDQDVADICASFQAAIADMLDDRTRPASALPRHRDGTAELPWSSPAASRPTTRSGEALEHLALEAGFARRAAAGACAPTMAP